MSDVVDVVVPPSSSENNSIESTLGGVLTWSVPLAVVEAALMKEKEIPLFVCESYIVKKVEHRAKHTTIPTANIIPFALTSFLFGALFFLGCSLLLLDGSLLDE